MARFGRSKPVPRRVPKALVATGAATATLTATFTGTAVATLGLNATGTAVALFTGHGVGAHPSAASGVLSATFTAQAIGSGGTAPTPYWIFQTPTVADEPPFLPDSTEVQKGLWRHYAPGVRGVTVFLLNNGTYVQDTATPGTPGSAYNESVSYNAMLAYNGAPSIAAHDDVNIPYPINYNYPGDPIVQTTNWDGTVIDTYINPYVVKEYFGGTNNVIDAQEVEALTAAGYGGYITPL